jgi:hypothetical protein
MIDIWRRTRELTALCTGVFVLHRVLTGGSALSETLRGGIVVCCCFMFACENVHRHHRRALDTAHLAVIAHTIYTALITNFGKPSRDSGLVCTDV